MNDSDILKHDLLFELDRCKELIDSQVLVDRSTFTQSAFIEIVIRLDFTLQKLSNINRRITWADDIQIERNVKDITDLINNLRNAICHIDSRINYIGNTNIKFVFNTFYGKGIAIPISERLTLENEYNDDIAFYYGDKRVYLVRHINRLVDELPSEINRLE